MTAKADWRQLTSDVATLPLSDLIRLGYVFRCDVQGLPVPGGSFRPIPMRNGKARLVPGGSDVQQMKLAAWRNAVQVIASSTRQRYRWDTYDGPVLVRIVFRFHRPKSSKDKWPSRKSVGDLDKLTRSTCDSLTDAGVIKDDARIISAVTSKRWTSGDPIDHQGAHILVFPVPVDHPHPLAFQHLWKVAA